MNRIVSWRRPLRARLVLLAAQLIARRINATVGHARKRNHPVAEEQNSQRRDRVRDVYLPVVVRIAGVVALDVEGRAEESQQERHRVADVDTAVVVAVAATEEGLAFVGLVTLPWHRCAAAAH